MAGTGSRREPKRERLNFYASESFTANLKEYISRHDELDLSSVMRDGTEMFLRGRLPVLGKIPCGPLAEAIEATPYFEIVPPILRPRADLGDYLLEASGDSMAPLVANGDLVILRPGVEWSQGEVCACQVFLDKGDFAGPCEATLKRVFRGDNPSQMVLRAINPAYRDMIVDAEALQIVGVMRGLIRRNITSGLELAA